MRLTLLGTQGWIPTTLRETTCFVVEDDERLLVFDAGTGLRRLVAPPWRELVERAVEVHLFLSHYHLDHVCGLAYVPGVFPDRRVIVHAPDEGLTGVEPARALAELIRPPYNPRPWHDLQGVELCVLRAGVNDVAGHAVSVRAQRHSDTSVAYRLDDALCVATDTAADLATIEFAAGVGVLLHEAWYAGDEAVRDAPASLRAGYSAHSEALAVAEIAAAADVGSLVLVHLNPLLDEPAYEVMARAARRVFGAADVRPDGDVVALAGGS